MRAQLTQKYIDALQPPLKGECWIADTQIRGFGIRLYASGKLVYCIRAKNLEGRAVRLSFDPFRYSYLGNSWDEILRSSEGADPNAMSIYLEEARAWAKLEIGRLKGIIPTQKQDEEASIEYELMRAGVGRALKTKTIGQLIDILLHNHEWRGWTEDYSDRLNRAFAVFDRRVDARDIKIGELKPETLWRLIDSAQLSPGNLRLLRSLFKAMAEQISDLGGPYDYQVFPQRPYWFLPRNLKDSVDPFFDQLTMEDLDQLFVFLRELPHNWRSKICIEMCLLTQMPTRRVMSGRWSQLIDGYWVPYIAEKRAYQRYRRIFMQEFHCLDQAMKNAHGEEVFSDYWFPNLDDANSPVASVDRAWFALLDRLGWPSITLSKFVKIYRGFYWRRRRSHILSPEFEKELEEIVVKMSKFPHLGTSND